MAAHACMLNLPVETELILKILFIQPDRICIFPYLYQLIIMMLFYMYMKEDISSCSSSIDLIAGSAHLYLMLPAIFVILIMADIEIYHIFLIFLIFSSSLKPVGLEFHLNLAQNILG